MQADETGYPNQHGTQHGVTAQHTAVAGTLPALNGVAQQGRFDWNSAAQLNPRYTFDAFGAGTGNQFARAAAAAVSE